MNINFKAALQATLQFEGGYVNAPADPGGATNFGITLNTYRAFYKRDLTVDDLRVISATEVATIYRQNYWDAMQCGDDMASGIDFMLFDFGVNSGPSNAIRMLQEAVGATIDGEIGPETLKLAAGHNPVDLIDDLARLQTIYYQSLHNPTFERGWIVRTIGRQATAKGFAQTAPAPVVVPVFVRVPVPLMSATPDSHWPAPSLWNKLFKR